MQQAVFLDRDGVIVRPEFRDGRSYAPTSLDQFQIYSEAPAALGKLKAAGYLLIVVTNQPDVGAGRLSRSVLDAMHEQIRCFLPIDDIYVCMHMREDSCKCRKPQPGMLLAAASKWNVDCSMSYMIGDRNSDIEAAHAAGCKSIFIDYNYAETQTIRPDFRVTTIAEATKLILSSKRGINEPGK